MPQTKKIAKNDLVWMTIVTLLSVLCIATVSKMSDLTEETRQAKASAAIGSMKAGALLAHSVQESQKLSPDATVNVSGVPVSMKNGYPTADVGGIVAAAGNMEEFMIVGGGSKPGDSVTISVDPRYPHCGGSYTAPTGLNSIPSFSHDALASACK